MPWKTIMNMALDKLRDFLTRDGKTTRENVTWRKGAQSVAVSVLLAFKQDGLLVLPTGYGKTLLPAIAAGVERHSLTIVAVPLNAIYGSTRDEFDRAGVPYKVWSPKTRLGTQDRLLLTTYNLAVTPEFTFTLAVGIREMAYARIRLCLDEGHMAATEDYRKDVLQIVGELRRLAPNMQIVTYSGTVPPDTVDSVRRALQLREGSGTRVLRVPTNRPELSFQLTAIQSSVETCVKQIVPYWRDVMAVTPLTERRKQRAIVFVQTGADGLSAVRAFEAVHGMDVEFYHGRPANVEAALSPKERADMLQRWLSDDDARSPFIVATVALANGFHYPHVRAIFNIGLGDGTLQQLQESARAARDGLTGWSFLFPFGRDNHGAAANRADDDGPDAKGKNALRALVFGNKSACLREGLFAHLDGARNAFKCVDRQGNAFCSRCLKGVDVQGSLRLAAPDADATAAGSVVLETHQRANKTAEDEDVSPPVKRSHVAAKALPSATKMPASGAKIRRTVEGEDAFPYANEQAKALNRRFTRVNDVEDVLDPLRAARLCFEGVCPACHIMEPWRRDHPVHMSETDPSKLALLRCPHLSRFADAYKAWALRGGEIKLPVISGDRLCFRCWLPGAERLPHPPVTGKRSTCPVSYGVRLTVFYTAFDTDPDRQDQFRRRFPDAPHVDDADNEGEVDAMCVWLMRRSDRRDFHNYLMVFAFAHELLTSGR